jgi:asparagine synthase (glutamine-hydrolysing)
VIELSPLEVVTGIVYGIAPAGPALAGGNPPAATLADAVRPALQRGPTFVSFSGGRDSSAVLATAAAVARREGLAPPIPVTVRARRVPSTHETTWQERVVEHAGLDDWMRIEVGDDLDVVGPIARRGLDRHGLLWPCNAHFHTPMLEAATGGTLLTGIGGDELWASACAPVLRRRRRLLGVAPVPVQRAVLARRLALPFPWLRPRALRAARRALADDRARLPLDVHARMACTHRMRYFAVGSEALGRLAADAGARIEHPLHDRRVWGALAAAAPRAGFGSKAAAIGALAGGVLPKETVTRRTKASFDAVFFTDHARAFIDAWDGAGVPDLVDVPALAAHWRSESPDAHTFTLLQALWVRSQTGERRE